MKARDALLFNLRAIMDERDLSYKDLGDKMGLTKARISALFNDDRNVTLTTVEKIAKALKIEETDLFDPNFSDRYRSKSKKA